MVVVWLVDSIITERTSTNTTLDILAKSACDITTRHKTSSGSPSLISLRYLELNKHDEWDSDVYFLQLWSLVPAETRDAYLEKTKTDTAPVLDLLPLGYSKVLGKGRLPEIPVVVRARYFSKEAERKIKEAGGIVELVA